MQKRKTYTAAQVTRDTAQGGVYRLIGDLVPTPLPSGDKRRFDLLRTLPARALVQAPRGEILTCVVTRVKPTLPEVRRFVAPQSYGRSREEIRKQAQKKAKAHEVYLARKADGRTRRAKEKRDRIAAANGETPEPGPIPGLYEGAAFKKMVRERFRLRRAAYRTTDQDEAARLHSLADEMGATYLRERKAQLRKWSIADARREQEREQHLADVAAAEVAAKAKRREEVLVEIAAVDPEGAAKIRAELGL